MNAITEKRKYTRLKATVPLTFHIVDSHAADGGAVSIDLGRGGLRFSSDRFFPMSSRIALEIDLPIPWRPIKVVVRVAWIGKTDTPGRFEVGAQILRIAQKDAAILTEYLEFLETIEK